MNASFDPAAYWNKLSGSTMRLSDVGWPTWTEAYNAYRYKLSLEQISAAFDTYKVAPNAVLEVGCGVGFWTSFLLKRFPSATITALDISENAIRKLSDRFSAEKRAAFQIADISTAPLAPATFDAAVSFEVMLHIVDDAKWQQALRNIFASLKPGGYAFISDPVAVYGAPPPYLPGTNAKVRDMAEWEKLFAETGMRLEGVQPRTLLLDDNFDFKSPTASRVWRAFFRRYNRLLKVKNERLGAALGYLAYHVDKQYTARAEFGHSCKLMVLRKAA